MCRMRDDLRKFEQKLDGVHCLGTSKTSEGRVVDGGGLTDNPAVEEAPY